MAQAPPTRNDGRQWFHVVISTYGSWLPGDPRGFRALHHRVHVEGDYRNPPPPGSFENFRNNARRTMKFPPRKLRAQERVLVGQACVEKLLELDAYLMCLAAATSHVHLLIKLPPSQARIILGVVKGSAYHTLHQAGYPAKLWAKRFKVLPVEGLRHFRAVYHYILRHAKEGAWIYKSELECP
jgi:hypothetical protein